MLGALNVTNEIIDRWLLRLPMVLDRQFEADIFLFDLTGFAKSKSGIAINVWWIIKDFTDNPDRCLIKDLGFGNG